MNNNRGTKRDGEQRWLAPTAPRYPNPHKKETDTEKK